MEDALVSVGEEDVAGEKVWENLLAKVLDPVDSVLENSEEKQILQVVDGDLQDPELFLDVQLLLYILIQKILPRNEL